MTIKQQGGIFGRNPTFNDVTIENDLTVTDDITGQSVTAETATITDTSSSFVNLYLTGSTSSTCRILMGDTDSGVVGQIRYSNSAESMEFRTGNSTAATFNSSGNLAFPSGQGIDFSATSGTGTSELFDDYEEGTFSPTVEGTSTAGTVSYTRREGVYTKVGNCVNFWIDVIWASGTGTGNLKITSLPFTSNSRVMLKTAAVYSHNLSLSAGEIASCILSLSSTELLIKELPTGGGSAADVSYDAAGQLVICGSYFV